MANKGRRYEGGAPKLNIKKVIAVIIALAVVIMVVIGITKLAQGGGRVQERTVANGYYAVYTGGKWGVINSKGEIVIDPTYEETIIIPDHSKDVFLCTYDVNYTDGTYKTRVINSKAEEIITGYDTVQALENYDESNNLWYENDVLVVSKEGKYGLVDFNGKELLPCEYDAIEALKAKLCDLGFEAIVETGNHLVDVLALVQADVAYFIDGWFEISRCRMDFAICVASDKTIILQNPLPMYDNYRKTLNLQNTLQEVTGVSFDKIRSPSRKQELFYARTLFAWYCHNVMGMTLSSIGQLINRDHSTICCCLKKYDELMEAILDDSVTPELIRAAVRKGTIGLQLCPVFMGSAYKNKGIQPLLDGVVSYLPNPTEVENKALDLDNNEKEIVLESKEDAKPVILAFKLEDGQFGQLTYIRIYQGKIKKGDTLLNTRTKKRFNVGRLVKMHASAMEDISEAGCGEIAALFGIDCASGDTFCDPSLNYSMTSMFVPNPVISLAIKPVDKKAADNMAKALNRFTKEDPTFQTYVDPESNQTIIRGMGELHLDVYIERMKREYKAEVEVGQPEVAYREAISQRADFNYTHKKQTGGSGQYARVAGYIEPIVQTDPDEPAKDYEFVNEVKGGAIPTEYIPSCDKGFQSAMKKGTQVGFPVIGVRCVVNDGQWHPVDSSDMAFQTAAIGAFREAFEKAKPVILEPIMKVEVEGPAEFQGNIFGSINQRRGMIVSSSEDNNQCQVIAEVPLSEMFGYSTVLRSLTQGKAEFTMEVEKYGRVPQSVSDELKKNYQEKKKKEAGK